MSDGPEIEGGFEFQLKAAIKAGLDGFAEREDARREHQDRLIPTDHHVQGGGVGPASGDLIFACGGPPLGKSWVLRRLSISGTDPTAVIAGKAYFFASSAGDTDQLIASGWFALAATLPSVSYFTSRQVVVQAGQQIWCRVTSPTSGTAYVVSGQVVSEIADERAAARYSL